MIKKTTWNQYSFGLLIAIFSLIIIRYQINLLYYKSWEDESETIVAAKLIASGLTLYSEIVSIHGPLSFLPGIIIEKIGSFQVPTHRIFILILELLAFLSVYFSPLLRSRNEKITYTALITSSILIYFPKFYGHTYIYQSIAALFIVIIFSQYTLPSICKSNSIENKSIIIGNALIASLPFLAISYIPASILLFLVSAKTKNFKYYLKVLLFFLGLNIFLAYLIGSLKGLYAFHVYLNTHIMQLYAPNFYPNNIYQIAINILNALTHNLSGYITCLIFIIFITNTIKNESIFYWRSAFQWRALLIVLMLLSLLIRGSSGSYALPYYYAMLCLPLCMKSSIFNIKSRFRYFLYAILFLCLIKLSLILPADQNNFNKKKLPEVTEFSLLVKHLTEKNDRIIAYTFQNYEYIKSERLPASGNYAYLPWYEKYFEDPIFNIKIDACADIKKTLPKIMLIDKVMVWEKYTWESYGQCINNLILAHYFKVKDRPYYIRNDLIVQYKNIEKK